MRLLLLLTFISSCTSLKAIDKPVCVELNATKGYCTTIISGQDIIVDEDNKLDGKTWFELRPTMIQVPVETWAALKKYLIINCKRSGKCNANIDSWNRSMKSIDDEITKKISP